MSLPQRPCWSAREGLATPGWRRRERTAARERGGAVYNYIYFMFQTSGIVRMPYVVSRMDGTSLRTFDALLEETVRVIMM